MEIAIHEVSTLHFDLKHLSPDQEFTFGLAEKLTNCSRIPGTP